MINKKLVSLFVGAVALLTSATAFAQTKDIQHDFSAFTGLSVTSDDPYTFEVTLQSSDKYTAVLTVDEKLADYAKAYVKGKTLILEVDEKNIPKETKQAYKAKGAAAPILRVVVSTPEINSVTLSGAVVLTSTMPIDGDKFSLTTGGNAQVKALNVNVKSATINTEKKSNTVMTISADDIELNTAGNSVCKVTFDCKNLQLSPKGSSEISVSGDAAKIGVNSANSSKITITGKANELNVKGEGSSNIEASNLEIDDCSVNLSNSCTVVENATKNLKLELQGNSTVLFGSDPKINIVSIKSSTVQHK